MNHSLKPSAIVIGAGPAGLMAAEQIATAGYQVEIYDGMPSAGRKLLIAGKSGLNLTHSEAPEKFKRQYRDREKILSNAIDMFDATAICAWARSLGIETFVGSSGRIFPTDMKAAPLLRAWLQRLRSLGVQLHMRQKLDDWNGDQLRFHHPEGSTKIQASAVVFALGGMSWKRFGSDGSWINLFRQQGVDIANFQPTNCGFEVAWSDHLKSNFAGTPLKNVIVSLKINSETDIRRQGQFVITETGIEGSLIYAISADLREEIKRNGNATLYLDLAPNKDQAKVSSEVCTPRGSRSISTHLKSKLGLQAVQIALIHECLTKETIGDPFKLAHYIKALPIHIERARPIDEAISCAGGVSFHQLDENLMLREKPGYFCAGEMLDWEAPTGGYLLTACLATGRLAGQGVVQWLQKNGK